MSIALKLDPAIESLGVAIGLLKTGVSGTSLDAAFFTSPWQHVSRMLQNATQRAALVRALDELLPAARGDPLASAGATVVRKPYPILDEGKPGQIYVVLERAGAAETADLVLSVVAEARAANGGPSALAEIAILTAQGSSLVPAFATSEHPLRIEARASLGAGVEVKVSLRVVAPPKESESRFVITLTGLPGEPAPLELDVSGGAPPLARIATALLELALAEGGAVAPPEVQRVAVAIPPLLGLTAGLPRLPVERLIQDPGAFRRWLAELATTTVGGRLALVTWLDALGRLLGAPAIAGAGPAATEGDPVVLTLLAPAGTAPGVALTGALRTDAATGVPVFLVGLRVELASAAVNAAILGEATVVAVPLGGTAPTTLLDRLELHVRAPGDGTKLITGVGAGALSVGELRGGLRYRARGPGAGITPLLELDDVDVTIAGRTTHYDRLDLTDAGTLTNAAETLVGNSLDAGLGQLGTAVTALRKLMGLVATNPRLDLGLFASAPTRALVRYYRALRAGAGGWAPVAEALASLLGTAAPAAAPAAGTADDPWLVELDAFAAPVGSKLEFRLALWDAGDAAEPRLRLALRAEFDEPKWQLAVDIQLLAIDLPPEGGGAVSWLGGVRAVAILVPPAVPASLDGVAVSAGDVELELAWSPGKPLAVSASVEDIALDVDGQHVDLGTLSFPLPGDALDVTLADLGLGLAPAALWDVARILLGRCAAAWGGPTARALLSLIGVGPARAGAPPPLRLPDDTDLRTLLELPLEAVRAWLTGVLVDEADALTPEGVPHVFGLLDLLQALLTNKLPAPWQDRPAPAFPVSGAGRPDAPWSVPLHDVGGPSVELLAWLDPGGPPPQLAAAALAPLVEDDSVDAGQILWAADVFGAVVPELGVAVRARDRLAGLHLNRLAGALLDGDGVVPRAAAEGPAGAAGWATGALISSAHADLPRAADAVAQVRDAVAGWTAGLSAQAWAAVLLAPQLAGDAPWAALLAGVADADRADVDLRVPGVKPTQVDLRAVPAASWYVTDLADDGAATLDEATTALARVVAAVRAAKPGARIVLVAHSYLVTVARAFVDANAAQVLGLVTLGAPLVDVSRAFDDDGLLEAARLSRALAPRGLDHGALDAALLGQVLLADGYAGRDRAGAPRAAPRLRDAFARGHDRSLSLQGVPALALAATVGVDLRSALATAVADVIGSAPGDAPSALAWGARVGLSLPAPVDGEPEVAADLRLTFGRVALANAAPAASAAPALEVRVQIARPGDWLLGGDGPDATGVVPARVRWAEIVASVALAGAAPRTTLDVRLHDAALRGDAVATARIDDPRGPELLDDLVRVLDGGAKRGGRVDAVLAVLASLGLVRRAAAGTPAGALADGFAAVAADANAVVASRLPAMLDSASGLLGLVRAAGVAAGGGPWRLTFAPLPIELVVEKEPWRVRLRTTGAGLPIGPGSTLIADAALGLAGLDGQSFGSLAVGPTTLGCAAPDAPLVLASPFVDAPLTLVPGDPALVGPALAHALPRLVVGGVLSALLEQVLGRAFVVASLDGLLRDPGGWLSRGAGLGDGTLPLAAPVNALLAWLAGRLNQPTSAARPIVLPGDLALAAADVGAGADRRFELELSTANPIELFDVGGAKGTLAITAGLSLDRARHVTPAGQLVLHVPLPGGFGSLDLTFGADASGLAASVALGNGAALTLLPQVTGFDSLVAAAGQQLLPEVLDQIVAAFAPRPPALVDALTVAQAFGVYDGAAAHGFKAKADALASLLADLPTGNLAAFAPAAANAVATLLSRLVGVNLLAPAPASGEVGLQLDGVLGGSIALYANLATTPPGVRVTATGLSAGAVTFDVGAGFVNGALDVTSAVAVRVDTGLGVVLSPRLRTDVDVGAGGVRLSLELRPLGTDDVIIALAPTPAAPTVDDLLALLESWVVPLAGTLLLRAADAAGVIALPVWPGATKQVGDLLESMEVATRTAGQLALATPLPSPPMLLKGLLDGLAGVPVPLPGGFHVDIVTDGQRYGLAVGGEQEFQAGDYSIGLLLGVPQALDPGWGSAGTGVGVLLLDLTSPTAPKLVPVLRLGGLGLRVGRANDRPLIEAGGFRLGAAAAYVRADVALAGAGAPKLSGPIYGAVELEDLGLVIGAGDNQSNPVAGSLLQSGKDGDPAPANPPFDLLVANGPAGFTVKFGGEAKLRIEVDRTFGPLHIDEIDVVYQAATSGPGKIGLGITGGVALSAFTVQANDLELLVPLDHPSDVGKWTVDLQGLSLSLDTSSVSVAGGMLKATLPGGVIDYEGMLSVKVAGRSFTAIGAYSRPNGELGQYTSLFVFVAISTPIGGPPYFFVEGLAGGLGFNRRLLTPRDPAAVPAFPLVAAMTGQAAASPMDSLQAISRDIPPSRGSFWLAAGLQFSTFQLLHTTALLTLALDHGFEVTLLGLMQLALPDRESAVVSLELALAAKYSTVDQVLSVRAGLTDNSWLLSPDCRLTGGFAFVAWFRGRPESTDHSPEVLLSIGGYSRKFERPPSYPDVPRLGFHWDVTKGIVVKGENFFALTHSAMMLGCALEASYNVSPIKVWFSADLDVIVWWDPFHYDVDASVSIGASFKMKVCFIACASVGFEVTLGASLHMEGPPLHGTVTVDLAISSVTVKFGEVVPQPYLTWPEASLKYLAGGTAGAPATAASIVSGVASVKTDKQPSGAADSPWPVTPEFSLRIESKMPATSWRVGGATQPEHASAVARAWYDLVPAGSDFGSVRARIALTVERRGAAGAWAAVAPSPFTVSETGGSFPGAVWDAGSLGDGTAPTPMASALASLELAAPVTTSEATGALQDVPFSSMVEEEAQRPLLFGTPATPPTTIVAPLRAVAAAAKVRAAPVEAPRLAATLAGPRVARAAVARARALAAPAARAGAVAGEALPQRGLLLWRVDPSAPHDLAITHPRAARAAGKRAAGGARRVRVTALNAAGALVADGFAAAARTRAPAGTRDVVVTDASDVETPGWELATPLAQVGPGTLLAPGATLHLPRPWGAAGPGTGAAPRWLAAATVSAALDGITTRFPPGAGARRTLVVRVDRLQAGARATDVKVTCDGATLGEPRLVRSGARTELVFPLSAAAHRGRAAGEAQAVSVTVTGGVRWRVAGVLLRADTQAACARLLARGNARLQAEAALATAAPAAPAIVKLAAARRTRR